MKHTIKTTQFLHFFAWSLFLVGGLQLALSFTSAGSSVPPNGTPSIFYPIMTANTNPAEQTKAGSLTMSPGGLEVVGTTTINQAFRINSGTPGTGKVLISDSQGYGSWKGLTFADDPYGECRRTAQTTTPGARIASASTKVGQNGTYIQRRMVFGGEHLIVATTTFSVEPGSCMYSYYHVATDGSKEYRYCDGIDERIYFRNGSWGDSSARRHGLNGTYAEDDGGNGMAFAVCKERAFTYSAKTVDNCKAGYGTVGTGHYVGAVKDSAATDPGITTGTFVTCTMDYFPPWTCPAETGTYRYSNLNLATGKCTRTHKTSGATAQVNVVKPGKVDQCAPGWTPYQIAGRCVGGSIN
ncbi:MAG TPA: hypothetical protein VGE62_03740 [Candidatus Paceibacterota bacterium]